MVLVVFVVVVAAADGESDKNIAYACTIFIRQSHAHQMYESEKSLHNFVGPFSIISAIYDGRL